jgi:hypothetical protein
MRAKNKLRARLEAMKVGATIRIAGATTGTPGYLRANNYVQRIRGASAGEITFSIRATSKSLVIERMT